MKRTAIIFALLFVMILSLASCGHVHTWDDGVVTAEPTDEAPGKITYTCLTCGKTRTETTEVGSTEGGTTEGGATKDETDEGDFTVTEEEWYEALDLLKNDNFVYTTKTNIEDTEVTYIINKIGDKILLLYLLDGKEIERVYAYYDGEKCYYYGEQGFTTDESISNQFFESYKTFAFNEFSYDESTKSYVAEEIEQFVPKDEGTMLEFKESFRDVRLKFCDNKLVSVCYDSEFSLDVVISAKSISRTITYGNAEEFEWPEGANRT